MRPYEALFILPPDAGSGLSKEEEKHIEDLIRRWGGRPFDRTDLGPRLLGYPLRKHREGRLSVWNFEMEPVKLDEFRKTILLDEKILKVIVTRKPSLKPEGAHAGKP